MSAEDDLEPRWLKLESLLTERLGKKPELEDVLLFIGKKESGLPPKTFTEDEKVNLRQMAVCTILVPARFYELYWVDDMGWPHFNQLERLPQMSPGEMEAFLKPYIIQYAEKNKMVSF